MESGYVPAPHSIHKELKKLPAAHYLLVDENGVTIQRYWNPGIIETEESWARRDENDLLDELDEILTRSVKKRMVSDVPVGAFLSGGIDSSLIVAMMGKHTTIPVKTFTIGFEEEAYDESPDAKLVADYMQTEHHCENLHVDDLLGLIPNFCIIMTNPFLIVRHSLQWLCRGWQENM